MIYDCRPRPVRGSHRFTGPVKVLDAATGEHVPNCFYLDTQTHQIGRFVTDNLDRPMVAADGKSRLERWETRPWVAVTMDGKTVVAKSGGAGEQAATGDDPAATR